MARRMTPAEYRRAVDKYNREARDHNRKVEAAARGRQRDIDKYNREARAHNNKVASAIKAYNREVRQYNFKVNARNREAVNQRRRLQDEIRRLNARSATVSVPYRQSVQDLATSYEAVEESLSTRPVLTEAEERLRNWASAEAANSAYLANALEGDTAVDDDTTAEDLIVPSVVVELSSFSDDLVRRWGGALFALNPRNPDAARHFCTSARDVLTTMLDTAAPDQSVLLSDSECERTTDGNPRLPLPTAWSSDSQAMHEGDGGFHPCPKGGQLRDAELPCVTMCSVIEHAEQLQAVVQVRLDEGINRRIRDSVAG